METSNCVIPTKEIQTNQKKDFLDLQSNGFQIE